MHSSLKSLEKDIFEIEEKLRKDEGRKAKIQEQLDNLVRQKDSAVSEVNKFQDEQIKLQTAIKQKQAELEAAVTQLQDLKTQTSSKQGEIRKLKEDYIHETTVKGQLNR